MAVESETSIDQFRVKILVASPNPQLRRQVEQKLVLTHWRVFEAGCGTRICELIRQHAVSECVLLLDPTLSDLDPDGFKALVAHEFPHAQTLMLNPQTGQLLMGSQGCRASRKLVRVMNYREAGSRIEMPSFFSEANHQQDLHRDKLRGMIGNAHSMQVVWNATRKVAAFKTTILITGESGTGKDLLAQEVHLISGRRNQPFVVVNCSAISETLLESDLFGHEKGSFTGATEPRIGHIHAAHGGTLYLDQVGDMPLSLQGKILRFLDQGEVQRLGGRANLKVDVRVIASTSVDLKERVEKQQFREDLYYRLAVFPLQLPPLRERMGDLEPLAKHFAGQFLPGGSLSAEAVHLLAQYEWRGNIRELRLAMERAASAVRADRQIRPEHFSLLSGPKRLGSSAADLIDARR